MPIFQVKLIRKISVNYKNRPYKKKNKLKCMVNLKKSKFLTNKRKMHKNNKITLEKGFMIST